MKELSVSSKTLMKTLVTSIVLQIIAISAGS